MSAKGFAVLLVVWCFLPLVAVQTANGNVEQRVVKGEDWVINNTTLVENEVKILNGNLIVQDGGNLTLSNVTLIMNCSYDGQYNIEVQSGGAMYVLNNSNITSANPNYEFMWWVRSESKFEMRDSELSECGWEDGYYGLTIETDKAFLSNSSIFNNHCSIYLHNSSNSNINACHIYNNSRFGVYLYNSSNSNINACHIYNSSDYGVWLISSSNNSISMCSVYNNYYGIELRYYSNNNQITAIQARNNRYGIQVILSSHNIIKNSDTTFNSNYGLFFSDAPHNIVRNSNVSNNGMDGLHYCGGNDHNNLYENLTISNNGMDGIHFWHTCDTTILNCTISDNGKNGIIIYYSSNNNIIKNSLITQNKCGVAISSEGGASSNNLIYHNNFINNINQAQDICTNYWYNETLGEGNYWSDYTGYDTDGDGIGDTPYYIPGGSNKDDYPLMRPWGSPNIRLEENFDVFSTQKEIRFVVNATNTEDQTISNVTVAFRVNNTLVDTQNISLFPQRSEKITGIWRAPTIGSHNIEILADPADEIIERLESDNRAWGTIRVVDLIVTEEDISFPLTPNGTVIKAAISNFGHVSAAPPIKIYLNNNLTHQEIIEIPPKSSVNISVPWNTPGEYWVEVVVDPDNLFIESDKTNNKAKVKWTNSMGLPDLEVVKVEFTPERPIIYKECIITAQIKNIGYAPFYNAVVRFYANDTEIGNTTLSQINPSNISMPSCLWNAKPAKITVKIDTSGAQEYNQANNEQTTYVTLNDLRYPDLSITNADITFSKANPIYGETIKIYTSVHNVGTAASDVALLKFYIGGNLYAQHELPSIDPASSNLTDILWEAKDITNIAVEVIPTGYDHITTNNQAAVYSPPPRKSDLMINRGSIVLPEEIVANQTIEILVFVYNIGNAPGEGNVTFEVEGILFKSESTGTVIENDKSSVTIVTSLPLAPGTYTARINILNLTFDSNVDNNEVLFQINVSDTPSPDLRIISIKTDPEYLEEGRGYYIVIEVLNSGNRSGDVAVIVFANGREIYNKTELAIEPGETREVKIGCNEPHGTNISVVLLSPKDPNEIISQGFLTVKTHPWYYIPPKYFWAIFLGTILAVLAIGGGAFVRLRIKETAEELATKSPYQRIFNYSNEFPGSTIKAISEDLGMSYKKTWKYIHKLAEERRGALLRLVKKEGEKDVRVYPEEMRVPRLLPPQREILERLIRHADGGISPSLLHDMIGMRWGKLQNYMKGTATIIGLEQAGYVVSRTIGARTKYLLNPELKEVIDALKKNPDTTVRELGSITKIKSEDIKKYLDMLVAGDIVTGKGTGEEARYMLKVVMG
ncbi:MAG: right-handed parallel beta-helix repeat-containing protein [Candidatus Thermoplasmatota archaeon]|nr:right-handed parallel beta-helix repeat-containing protein [Candidatus Thermoplasmatota archaeon]